MSDNTSKPQRSAPMHGQRNGLNSRSTLVTMGSRAGFCAGWLLMALFWVPSRSVGATFYDSEYLIDSWQTEQGLPENSANALVQTSDGYLWLGTFNGLVRFDGQRFEVFNPANTPALPSDGIINLHLDQSGRLWISTLKGIVVRENNQWSVLKKSQVSQSNFIRTFSEAAGVICATTFDGKVLRVQAGQMIELPAPPGLAGQGYWGHVDRAGTIWAGQDHFFGSWDGQHWIPSPLASAITNGFRGLGTGNDGSLLAMNGKTILRINAGQITAQLVMDEDPNILWRIYEDSHTNIWLCTQEKGLYRVSPSGATRQFSTTNGLLQLGIRFAFEDREKNLWIGSSGDGLVRMKRRMFTQPEMAILSPTLVMTALVEESPGKILVGSYGKGLARMENDRTERINPIKSDPRINYTQSVLSDRDGNLWIATYHDGVFVLGKNRELRNLAPADSGGVDSAALFEDSRGRIWIGGDQTISLFANGQFQPFTNSAGLSLGGVKSFAEDTQSGEIWAGSAEGLFRFEGGRWSEFKDSAGHSLDETICLRADGGTLWIGGSTVPLRRLRAGVLTTISGAQGLPVGEITCMLDDGLGFWWLGSNRGVLRVARGELEATAEGKNTKLSCQVFNLSDGLPSVECVAGFQSTALKDSDGRLWFATTKGVATINPRTLSLNTNPPPVFIEQFRAESKSGEQTPVMLTGAQPVVVAAGQRELKTVFSALSYTAPEKVRFAYKLEGYRDEWVDIGNRSTLYFFPPPPGKYVLRVKAANNDGVWNETGATLAFTVQPFMWQTLWFRVLALAGLIGGTSWGAWRVGRSKLNQKLERLNQERALARERARLASVLETTSDFVGFTKPDGQVLFINRAGRRLLGLGETQDVRALNVADHYPAWAEKLIRDTGLPAAIREGIWNGELALKHQDGHEIPVSQVIVVHRTPDNSLDFISTIARDISEQKQVQRKLIENSRFFELLINHMPNQIFWKDRALVYQGCNNEFARIVGLASADLVVGMTDFDFARNPSFAEAYRKIDQQILDTGEPILNFEEEFHDSAGNLRHVLTSRIPIKGVNHSTLGVLGVCVEITERKRAEAALRLSETKYRKIFENVQDVFYQTDLHGTIIEVSPSIERYSGTRREEWIGQSVTAIYYNQEDGASFLDIVREKGEVNDYELRLKTKTEHSVYVSVNAHVLLDAAGKPAGIEGSLRDITERHKLGTDLRQSQKMEGIGQLAGGVAHDFNNILSALLMQTDLLATLEPLPEEARDGLQEIRKDVNRAAELTRQLLLFSRRQVMQVRLLNLNDLVLNLGKMLQRIIGEDVQLQLFLNPAGLMTHADAGMLEQVLMNLCVNARDAMPGGGRLLVKTSAVEVDDETARLNPEARPGHYVCLSVGDTGHGIPPEILPKIFEPFFTTKEAGKGTGLGLATVFGIVKQHQGWIKVDNRPGQGVTFHIFLPASTEPVADATSTETKPKPRGGTETILLVEDEESVRKPTRRILERYGYQVLEAANGIEALECWDENRASVSLLLTDLVMPKGVSGRELAQQLVAKQPGLKVIYTSGYSADVAGRDFHLRPGEAFLQKPCQTPHLLETIRRSLDG